MRQDGVALPPAGRVPQHAADRHAAQRRLQVRIHLPIISLKKKHKLIRCVCPPGWIGSGIGPLGCTQSNVSACQPNPCVHGKCHSLDVGRFECHCDEGYTDATCGTINGCSLQRCTNGGTCQPSTTPGDMSFTCQCPNGFIGEHCERSVDGLMTHTQAKMYQLFSHLQAVLRNTIIKKRVP